MARKMVVELVDDLDGSVIEAGEGEHNSFLVNGVDYEIDLKTKNAREFLKTMDFYIEHATKIGGDERRPTAKAGSARSRSRAREVRGWAAASGYEVSARGRIPTDVQEAFDAAH
ncbi:Lsr2 family protein [Rhodococcus sp. ZPP]|uniref:histone-like nucleoid-structuring protein Lsr2 n=1 Tax=Rhodococcus sp. ZPP TaxID=2749906 RepID=UPI001AD89B6D|nr:Lsr2 family protein [Rhodococcus sp. ZPP]QTJ68638.1 Lsr2 family protein [Rhodococcus sp. ZPP]